MVTVVGTKKYHFMSDTKWLLDQGFAIRENIPSGFSLISMDFNHNAVSPRFNDPVKSVNAPINKDMLLITLTAVPILNITSKNH